MILRLIVLCLLLAKPLSAQEFSAIATVDMAQSSLRDTRDGIALDLQLSIPVPYRVFKLDDPRRVVLSFREVDWNGVTRDALLNADGVTDVRFGPLTPGWSRMVIDLAAPMRVVAAGMAVDPQTSAARLTLTMAPTSEAAFRENVGAPQNLAASDIAAAGVPFDAPVPDDGPLIVAIDAGHGGIDPGAQQAGLNEADIVLALAFDVVEAINRTGRMQAVLIRDADYFIPLEERMTRARTAGASVFISLHADSLEADGARGAAVYTLAKDAADAASTHMAERHAGGDLLTGLDLTGQEDRVATVLMDLARLETGPAGERLADALVDGMKRAGVGLNSKPRRGGNFAVLNSADFASVLIEVGFLSSDVDRAALTSPLGRAALAAGIAAGLVLWDDAEAARAPLIRQ
mgnify:CR=1 FL=1